MRRRSPVTTAYLAAIVGMYFAVATTGGTESLSNLVRWGALFAPAVHAGEYWRLITPIFLHGGLLHLVFNGFALYQLGPLCELLFGHIRFAVIFLLCGIGGSLLSITMNPRVVAVGASGAIFGLAGLLIVMALRQHTQLSAVFRRSLLRSLVPCIGYNLFLGMTVPGIDNWGHIGGLAMGAVVGLAVRPARI